MNEAKADLATAQALSRRWKTSPCPSSWSSWAPWSPAAPLSPSRPRRVIKFMRSTKFNFVCHPFLATPLCGDGERGFHFVLVFCSKCLLKYLLPCSPPRFAISILTASFGVDCAGGHQVFLNVKMFIKVVLWVQRGRDLDLRAAYNF